MTPGRMKQNRPEIEQRLRVSQRRVFWLPKTKAGRDKLQQTINALALAKSRICRVETLDEKCILCKCPISYLDEYRDGGKGRRAHYGCFNDTASVLRDLDLLKRGGKVTLGHVIGIGLGLWIGLLCFILRRLAQ